MTAQWERQHEALMCALQTARENEQRWMEISPDFFADSEQLERIEEWAGTARLLRLEIERIEFLLAQIRVHRGLQRPVGLAESFAGNEKDAASSTQIP